MNALVEKTNQWLSHPDAAKFILRVGFGAMMLLHGIHKAMHGTGFIEGLFVDLGLPAWFAYSVFIGEILAPLMMILGWYSRIGAVLIVGTSVVVIGLVHLGDFFTLSKVGGWIVEDIAVYLFAGIAVAFLGSGKYAVKPD
ncbi:MULTISPECIES: DoxX family protein [Vibrio]|uniref:DoxX family membrane protein n=2 Tax=Vibrio TaxID=662 RepID=A0A7X4LHT5_9VIBR|nr:MULTISPECIES: DoxX family protein [Vibrio]MBF8999575.1 DoxX family protein [Vibrio nitrifigilis]MZI92147.1 DoxX family membrane protein [Vibrio eleionomae]